MNGQQPTSDQRMTRQLAARERSFADTWRRVEGDDERAALFKALDPLRLEGEPVISVHFDPIRAWEWLQIELSGTAPHGIEWVTFHCADVVAHTERLVTETRTPALWLAATYYADLAAQLLVGGCHREDS